MTGWRQEGNGRSGRGRFRPFATALAGLWLGFGAASGHAQTTTERVVINRTTGYAISGFDPVAYFTEGGPLQGQSPHEMSYDGALWRFANEGNLIVFQRHPDIYEPLFGGYDPIEVARGKPVAGRPGIWAILDQRLMLFSSPGNRRLMLANPQRLLSQATRRWPELRQQLSP